MTGLDRPVWASLCTAHLGLSEGDDLARRYLPDVNLFAAARDDSRAALERLSALIGPGQQAYVLQAPAIGLAPALVAVKRALGVQMVDSGGQLAQESDEDIARLTEADGEDMLALATLTEPGPFLTRTHAMGQFLGVRVAGRLAAMAGERMRFPGYTEVSGVCTHPDFRGRGLARRLSAAVMASIRERGDIPFLHAWKTNTAAIRLYENLGFEHRCDVHVVVVANAETP